MPKTPGRSQWNLNCTTISWFCLLRRSDLIATGLITFSLNSDLNVNYHTAGIQM